MKIIQFEKKKDLLEVVCVFDNPSEWQELIEKAKTSLASHLKVKGFREGKLPSQVAAQYLKNSEILDKASQLGQEKIFQELLNQKKNVLLNKYRLLQTKVEKISFSEFQLFLQWQQLPSAKITKSKDFQCDLEPIIVSDQEVEDRIMELRKHFAVYVEKNTSVQEKDFVLINYQGKIDSKVHDHLSAKNFNYQLGQGKFGKEFDFNIVKMTKGEKKSFSVQLPKDYLDSSLTNKKVQFDLEVIKVQKQKLPDPQTDLIANLKVEKIKSFADLKKMIIESIERVKLTQMHSKIVALIWPQLLKNSVFDIPNHYFKAETSTMKTRYVEDLKKQSKTLVQQLAEEKKTEKEFDVELEEKVKKTLQNYLLINEVADLNKITVSDKEIDDYYQFLSKNQNKKLEEVKNIYSKPLLFNNLLRFKVEDFLVKNTLEFNKLTNSTVKV